MRDKKSLLIIAFLFATSMFFSPALAKADICIKKSKHSDEVTMMGRTEPAKDEEGTTWIAKDKMREDLEQTTTILRFDLQKIYVIDHNEKTYSEVDLPIDLEKIIPSQAKQMLESMQVSSKITDTGETKKIKDWKCKKYLVEISASIMGMNMPITMEIWTSKDLGIDTDIHKKFTKELLSLNPMTGDFSKEYEKMEGYPVLTLFSMSIMGAESKFQEEVVSVEKIDPPEGLYELPEGYTKKIYNPFEQKKKNNEFPISS